MIGKLRRGVFGGLAISLLATAMAGAAPITPERLLATGDEPQNWLMGTGDYGAHRYSGLDALSAENAGRVKLLFTVSLGPISVGEGFEHTRLSAPLVEDGMAYMVDPFGVVYRIDVTSGVNGHIMWTSPRLEQEMDPWLIGQWSLTLHGDSVILAAGDGRLFWIDRESGAVTHKAAVADPSTGYVLAAPPVLVGDTLVIGGAGGDRGARPQLTGLDANDGTVKWRSFLTGEEFTAGASILRTGAYDAESGLVLWSTDGPASAYSETLRAGDNAANALLAVDPEDGTIAWQRPLLASDVLGFSDAATPVLLPDGGAVQAGDDGFVRRFDVTSGALDYAEPYVTGLDWYDERDADGAPISTGDAVSPPGCPNILAEEHMPASYSTRTNLFYAAQNNGCRTDLSAIGNLAGEGEGGLYAHSTTSTGALSAIDPANGAVMAEHLFDYPLQSGLLTTAGGLVVAMTADGSLHLLDDTTLDTLWSQHISSFMAAPPMSYSVDGRQYIGMIVGGGPLYSDISFRSRDMAGVRHLAVFAVFGVEP